MYCYNVLICLFSAASLPELIARKEATRVEQVEEPTNETCLMSCDTNTVSSSKCLERTTLARPRLCCRSSKRSHVRSLRCLRIPSTREESLQEPPRRGKLSWLSTGRLFSLARRADRRPKINLGLGSSSTALKPDLTGLPSASAPLKIALRQAQLDLGQVIAEEHKTTSRAQSISTLRQLEADTRLFRERKKRPDLQLLKALMSRDRVARNLLLHKSFARVSLFESSKRN
ncbi:hypothetical protein BCV70DRAFT_104889 [Testicularia cyperi]|uniref:Uncharacterized protein n=1 Tax=Testicularia cyperi TaxID=1882483 RepID=A0A317XQC3_9BASI|nr:hypothetical protein BCV70DRAFT_104889 [Testicularia cyperi]